MDNKKFYEKCLGQKISERTWQRDKAIMRELGLLLSKENLKLYADIKTIAKRFSLPIAITTKYFLGFQPTTQLRGIDIYFKILELISKKPHPSTIHRWFPGGYKLEKIYAPTEVSEILLHAFIYKLRIEKNGTRKEEHRSYKISA